MRPLKFSQYGNLLVLDVNGVLRDAKTAKQRALAEILDMEFNPEEPFTREYVNNHAPHLLSLYNYASLHLHLMPEFKDRIEPVKNVRESLLLLQKARIPMGICTSRNAKEFGAIYHSLEANNLLRGASNHRFFHRLRTTEGQGKRRACEEMGAWGIVDDSVEKISDVPIRRFVIGEPPAAFNAALTGVEYFPAWHAGGKLVLAERIVELYRQDFGNGKYR